MESRSRAAGWFRWDGLPEAQEADGAGACIIAKVIEVTQLNNIYHAHYLAKPKHDSFQSFIAFQKK